jgi:Tol biopolymer transport system component/DNA-binding CsgD family transcriptional regulator
MRRGRPPYPGLLTPREQEVLGLLRLGLTNREIGDRLGISSAGVAYHVSEILSKLGVGSREEAAALGPEALAGRRRLGILAFLASPLRRLTVPSAAKVAGAGVIGMAATGALLLAFGVITMDDREAAPEPLVDQSLGKLAYVSGGNVWVRPLPGGSPAQLTDEGRSFSPRWSASGEWLLFLHREGDQQDVEYAARVVRADGSSSRHLTNATAAWSPVEDLVAYLDDDGSIEIEDADGTGRRELVPPTDGSSLSQPTWSPDGKLIAYTETSRDRSTSRLMTVPAGGGAPSELLSYQDGTLVIVQAWSGDGEQLLFWKGAVFSAAIQADGLALWRVPVGGGQPEDLHLDALTYEEALTVEPGGSEIAIIQGSGRNAWENKQLIVQDLLTGEVDKMTPDGVVSPSSPAWSPDGSQIAYAVGPEADGVPGGSEARDALAQRRIFLADVGSARRYQVTLDEAYRDERPLWSRDGGSLLFARLDAEDTASLWVLTLSDGLTQRVATDLSLGDARLPPQPDLWFGYYGHIAWEQYFDWWQPPG